MARVIAFVTTIDNITRGYHTTLNLNITKDNKNLLINIGIIALTLLMSLTMLWLPQRLDNANSIASTPNLQYSNSIGENVVGYEISELAELGIITQVHHIPLQY